MVLICHQRSAQLVCWSEAGPPEIDTHPKFNSSPLKNDGTGRRIIYFPIGVISVTFHGKTRCSTSAGELYWAFELQQLRFTVWTMQLEVLLQSELCKWYRGWKPAWGLPRSFVATLKVAMWQCAKKWQLWKKKQPYIDLYNIYIYWLVVSNLFYFHPEPLGLNDPIWSNGLAQPPTSIIIYENCSSGKNNHLQKSPFISVILRLKAETDQSSCCTFVACRWWFHCWARLGSSVRGWCLDSSCS